jgi:hypothetical protein
MILFVNHSRKKKSYQLICVADTMVANAFFS